MKKINNKEFRRLVESRVRRFLKEELDPMDTVMRDSDELDHNNPYDDMRISQEMDKDWKELDRLNHRGEAYKNPILHPKYSHNVEDGREEAEAYVDMFESKVRRMVKQTLNEMGDTEWGQYKLGALLQRKANNCDFRGLTGVQNYSDNARVKALNAASAAKDDKAGHKIFNKLGRAFYDGYSDADKRTRRRESAFPEYEYD